jgi:hypothetical protein
VLVHRIGIVLVSVLAMEAIPLGILVSALLDSSLRHRARFALRLAGFTVIQAAPAGVLVAGMALRVLSEQAVGELLAVCVLSVFVSPALMPILLFHGPDQSGPSGKNDDEDHGPGPGRNGPLPPRPIGRLPLPDAEPSSARTRGPLPLAPFRWPRRPAHEPDRTPSRLLSALRCRWL